jgi:hypothetical protein
MDSKFIGANGDKWLRGTRAHGSACGGATHEFSGGAEKSWSGSPIPSPLPLVSRQCSRGATCATRSGLQGSFGANHAVRASDASIVTPLAR